MAVGAAGIAASWWCVCAAGDSDATTAESSDAVAEVDSVAGFGEDCDKALLEYVVV